MCGVQIGRRDGEGMNIGIDGGKRDLEYDLSRLICIVFCFHDFVLQIYGQEKSFRDGWMIRLVPMPY